MNGNVFPLPFATHLIFTVIAAVFFLVQFARLRYKYQIVMAAAVVSTLLIYANDSKTWFYGMGILELGLLLLALVLSIVEKRSRKALESELYDDEAGEEKTGEEE